MTDTTLPAPVAPPPHAPVGLPDADAGLASTGLGPPVSNLHAPPANLFRPARGESDRAFEAFRAYLELGPRRRYSAVVKKVGASLRTVKRWAADFDWRGRIKTCAAQHADLFVASETAVQHEELQDATQRAQAFRERQYDVAEALLLAAERFLERLDEDALDQLSFADACKALDVASRLGRSASARESDAVASPAQGLRDQLATLLDQAFGDSSTLVGAATPVSTAAVAPTTSSSPASLRP